MNNSQIPLSIEDACKKIDGLDIYNDSAATMTFFKVAIEYVQQELMAKGIDLFRETNQNDLQEYCWSWFKDCKKTDNDLALIALTFAIEYDVHKLAEDRRNGNQ